MSKTTNDLLLLTKTGVNLVIDATTKSTSDLILIAGSIGQHGGHLRLIKCSELQISDLLKIISTYPNNITLDFVS